MQSGADFNLQYVFDLIALLTRSPEKFWDGKGAELASKSTPDPVGITSLKTILNQYKGIYNNFSDNEVALIEFFNTCRDAVGEEILKFDKKYPNACTLYSALIEFDKEKIQELNEQD